MALAFPIMLVVTVMIICAGPISTGTDAKLKRGIERYSLPPTPLLADDKVLRA